LRRELGLAGAEVLVYSDAQRGEQRVLKPVRLSAVQDGPSTKAYGLAAYWLAVTAVEPTPATSPEATPAAPGAGRPSRLAGPPPPAPPSPRQRAADTASAQLVEHWRGWLDSGEALAGSTRDWLAPGARSAAGRAPRPRQVCTCFDVDEQRIVTRLAALPGAPVERLAALQGELKCGTNCGSCLPALRSLMATTPCRAEVVQAQA
jgi:bacterioferritin-associated ferredoxin